MENANEKIADVVMGMNRELVEKFSGPEQIISEGIQYMAWHQGLDLGTIVERLTWSAESTFGLHTGREPWLRETDA